MQNKQLFLQYLKCTLLTSANCSRHFWIYRAPTPHHKTTTNNTVYTAKKLLQVFAIELVIFAVDFIPLAVEFGTFAVEFVDFAVEFVAFALQFIALEIELDAFAMGLVCLF